MLGIHQSTLLSIRDGNVHIMLVSVCHIALQDKKYSKSKLTTNVQSLLTKVIEQCLCWYGQVLRNPEDHTMQVAFILPMTTRRRKRSPATWLTTVQITLKFAK